MKHAHRLKVKEWEKIIPENGKGKRAGVAILISDKINFKTKAKVRDKEGHYIMIKRTIQQEDTTLVNIYTPNKGSPTDVKHIFMDIKKRD